MSEFVPEGWKVLKICDFAKVTDGAHKTPTYTDDGVPFLRVTDMKHKNVFNKGIKYISRDEHEMLIKRCNPEVNDILYSKNGTIGITRLIDWSREFSIFVSLALIKIKTESVTPFYLKHILNSEIAWKQIRDRSKQGTVTNLHLEEIKEFDIPTPPLPEQQKIAAILTSVDEVIEKIQAQINKLKDLKTGMMQELLTRGVGVDGKPHTEFKDSPVGRIPKAWEVVKFKDIFHDYKYGPRFSSKDYDILGNVKTIRGTDLSSNGVIKYKQVPIAKLEKKLVEQNSLQDGDLVMITTADCGATAVFESQDLPYIASAYAIKLTPKEGLNSKYINYFMQTSDALSQVDSFIRKGTVANLPGSDVMSITLALPSKDEQNKIVLILGQLDKRIALKENALKSKSYLKKALMQDLLTGKVRVKVDTE